MVKYMSYRDLPLLAQEPNKEGRPIITMENYCKWYGVQVLFPDGRVDTVEDDVWEAAEKKAGVLACGDHNFHPSVLTALANEMGGVVDPQSLEMVAHRWEVEINDKDEAEFPNAYPKD